MRSGKFNARWLAPVLFLLVGLSVACTGGQERVQAPPEAGPADLVDVEAPEDAAPEMLLVATPSAASRVLAPTPTATLAPAPTETQVQNRARRSDFIVRLSALSETPSPTFAAALAVTPNVSAALVYTGSLLTEARPGTDCTYDAQFVADVTVPDGTLVEPGSAFTKTWRVRNSGTCDWEAGVSLHFADGDGMDSPASIKVSPAGVGDAVDVSVPFLAPHDSGEYASHWQLRTSEGQQFGDAVYAQVVVGRPAEATPTAEPQPAPGVSRVSPLVLLNYFAWYDGDSWDDCNISAGDKPLQPYHSDDTAAIGRHVRMALDAGADGFTQQWFAPGDRTDRNFAALLAQSQGTGFRSTVVFLRHIWPGAPAADQATVADAIRYLIQQYGGHPNFLKLEGKPVLFFTDVYRVPTASGQNPQGAWASIRAQVDPGGEAVWIAEGLDPSYLSVFDGLWVYKITHAAYPQAYLKASQWAEAVRQWGRRTGARKLWVATLSPGWDDTRAGCKVDVRVPSAAHVQLRGEGAFYRATFDAALASEPDWLWVNSFNEWVEGTYVEPSVSHGELYLQLTRQFAGQFKSR
jgi:hypothetical protein